MSEAASLPHDLQVQHARMVLAGWRFKLYQSEGRQAWEVFDDNGTWIATRWALEEAVHVAWIEFYARDVRDRAYAADRSARRHA